MAIEIHEFYTKERKKEILKINLVNRLKIKNDS